MGWNSGGDIADELWAAIARYIPPGGREKAARAIVEIFEAHDSDVKIGFQAGQIRPSNENEENSLGVEILRVEVASAS